ncbi:hypothetical protein SLS62_000296 [Diatrype stigma]|uniref:Uncharacterized protein n=1 Tax=Diatrype stigma TaxID=117547 RepID=A0AAN9V0P3_9PEZI
MSTSNRLPTNGSYAKKGSSASNNSAPANSVSYPNHPLIKMPGQAHNVGSDTIPSSSGLSLRQGDTSRSSGLKMSKQTQPHPAPETGSSKPATRILRLSHEQWEQVSEDTEKYLDDDTNYIVDCFINARETMAELERAIRKTTHREKLITGITASNVGLDCLGSDLFRIIKGTIDELSGQA